MEKKRREMYVYTEIRRHSDSPARYTASSDSSGLD